jgi:hypothetical protein
MRVPSLFLAAAFIALSAASAFSHEDYEELLATISTPAGDPIEIVRHWTDGIVVYDPAKLVLRRPNGEVLAESEFRRNIVVTETADNRWLAFSAEPWNFFYHRAWWIETGELVPASDFAHIPRAFLIGMQEHRFAYATSVSLIVAALAAWLAIRRPGAAWRWISLVSLALFWLAIGELFVWMWVAAFTRQADYFDAAAMTTVAAMFAFFFIRVCQTRSGTLGLSSIGASFWFALIVIYGTALPIPILLIAGVVSLFVYLLFEKLPRAELSPVSS